MNPGDVLVAYLTGLSRWVGLFEVTARSYEDNSPLFSDKDDLYKVRLPIRRWRTDGRKVHSCEVWSAQ